jgi:peptidoglycan L-alanyl-D-glutamate endopeptidase CwlK
MPVFSQTSKDKLSLAHRDLQTLFNEVIKWYDCTIADSYRTKAAQHQFLLEGKSKVDYPTVHNTKPSNAVDVYPYEVDHIDWGQLQSAYFAGWIMGIAVRLFEEGKITHRIRCGIDWDKDNDIDDNAFWDAGHFEIIPNPGETFQYFET